MLTGRPGRSPFHRVILSRKVVPAANNNNHRGGRVGLHFNDKCNFQGTVEQTDIWKTQLAAHPYGSVARAARAGGASLV